MTQTAEGRLRFSAFLDKVAEQVERPQAESAILTGVAAALGDLVRHDDWLDDTFAESDPDRYRQYLLFCDARRRFSVVSFVWAGGQVTPIHDHTVWGAVGVLRGAEISVGYEVVDGQVRPTDEVRLEPGDVALLSPEIGDIHQVRNAFENRTSVSIHVYGADIGAVERHVFSPTGGEKLFVSGYTNAMLPNPWGRD